GADRDADLAAPVMSAEVADVEVGQHVPVDDEEGLVELLAKQRQRADGAERTGLRRVADVHSRLLAVAAHALEEMAKIARRNVNFLYVIPAQPFEQEVQNRLGSNRHQRLRQNHGVWPQPRSLSAALNDSFHEDSPFWRMTPPP